MMTSAVDPKPSTSSTAATKPTRGERALTWWRANCELANNNVDPATRARLRRARSHTDVLRVPPAIWLARQLGAASEKGPDWYLHAVLDLTRVLAHVKEHETRHPMDAAGWQQFPSNPDSMTPDQRPRLAEARFKRLLAASDGEEKVDAFVRLIALLGGTINVEQLAKDFLDWNHPDRGPRVRERWAFHYFGAAAAAPSSDSTTDTEGDRA